ncbi:hypothetical protein AB2D70_26420 (plasmid) [Escherichia coli]
MNLLTPEGETVRAFRTGDIGFYRPDGVIMFATRINGYVKIRGVRVSLPEIEDVFRQHPAIHDIVVVDYATDDANEKSLGAICLVGDHVTPGAAELRAFAQRYLPCTHIPGRFITRHAFPLTVQRQDRSPCAARQPGANASVPIACAERPRLRSASGY